MGDPRRAHPRPVLSRTLPASGGNSTVGRTRREGEVDGVIVVEAETDGTLIERSCRGRPDAFVEVVRRHEAAVHGFLARRAGPQAAADLLGEVWLRAFAGRGGYDPAHRDARPWLYGIARNVLRAHWRANRLGDDQLTAPEARSEE